MNKAVTIGFRTDGTSEIITSPDVPFSEQRRAFRSLVKTKRSEFERIEIWTAVRGRTMAQRCRKGGVDCSHLTPAPREAHTPDTYNPPVWVPPVPVLTPDAPAAPVSTKKPSTNKPGKPTKPAKSGKAK